MTTDKQPQETTESVSTAAETVQTEPSPSVAMATDKQPMVPTASGKKPDIAMETAPGGTTQLANESSTSRISRRRRESVFSEERPSAETAESSFSKVETNLLSPIFTNWPCIVTTVLGYYPPAQSVDRMDVTQERDQPIGLLDDHFQDWPSQGRALSSVQALDAFTSHLVLNCSEDCVRKFTSTIVEKINLRLAESNQCSFDLFNINVNEVDSRSIDEKILPVLVGKRFLDSVIRILGMEHSRVRNTFAEMQQVRSRASASAGTEGAGLRGGERGRERAWHESPRPGTASSGQTLSNQTPKNVLKVTK